MNSGEKNSLSGRKRKSLSTDDEELPSKRARRSKEEIRSCSSKNNRHGKRIYLCSSDECTNQAVNGGLCIRHGAKRTRCSSEGCTNSSFQGGVCIRHGAQVQTKRCSTKGCAIKSWSEVYASGMGHSIHRYCVLAKDVQIELWKKECTKGILRRTMGANKKLGRFRMHHRSYVSCLVCLRSIVVAYLCLMAHGSGTHTLLADSMISAPSLLHLLWFAPISVFRTLIVHCTSYYQLNWFGRLSTCTSLYKTIDVYCISSLDRNYCLLSSLRSARLALDLLWFSPGYKAVHEDSNTPHDRLTSVSASVMVVVEVRSPIRMSRVVVDDNGDGWCIMMGTYFGYGWVEGWWWWLRYYFYVKWKPRRRCCCSRAIREATVMIVLFVSTV